jgi:hypothetical protein
MGYRSEVRAAFYTLDEREWPALRIFVEENFPKDLDEDLSRITSNGMWGYDYNASSIKWYESYPEIQEFEKFMRVFDDIASDMLHRKTTNGEAYTEHANHWAYEFVRIGEDEGDIERKWGGRANNYPLLNVVTTVDAEYQTNKD